MSQLPEIESQWLPIRVEGFQNKSLIREPQIDELSNDQVWNDGPDKTRYAKEQLRWAIIRLTHATPGGFDAEFLSGIIAATPDGGIEQGEILGKIGTGEGDEVVVSKWFVSGYVSTKMLFKQCDFSRLRFTADLGDESVAVIREKYLVDY